MRTIWVIYKRPTDFPNSAFVMREHIITNGKVIMGSKTWQGANVGQLRKHVPEGKTRKVRAEQDEPQIVEWWF